MKTPPALRRPGAALALALLLLPGLANGAQPPDAFLVQNPQGRESVLLDGGWRVIPDPYENGYYKPSSRN